MKTKQSIIFCIIIILSFIIRGYSAKYKGKDIDGEHYSAKIWIEESETKYRVDVVFVKKAANIVFKGNQILPITIRNDKYMTLYLIDEEIKNPDKIKLRQVKPPPITNTKKSDPTEWETAAIWYMEADIK